MMKKDSLYKYSINDWETEFAEIYSQIDGKRRPTELWLMLVEDASKVAEAIRKDKYADAIGALAHVFCWTCSFVHRCRSTNDLNIKITKTLSEIVWHKFPNRCSLCGQSRCICSVRRAELEELSRKERNKVENAQKGALDIQRKRTEEIPKTLDKLTKMFSGIYKGAHYAMPKDAIAFHFMEEVGEVATDIRKLREQSGDKNRAEIAALQLDLEDEIADIISWTMSLLSKLDYLLGAGTGYQQENGETIQTAGLKLSDIVWQAFESKDGKSLHCHTCKSRPCRKCGDPITL